MIPKIIFQSWKTKELSPVLQKNVKKIKDMNPEYEYLLYDDLDCKKFLLDHFGVNYANAFDILIPGAFKCDFWRYAVLYVYGGVYLDMDITPYVPFRDMIDIDDEFISTIDRSVDGIVGIYQAFIACTPRHPIMKLSLDIAFVNIATRKIGMAPSDILSITGPGVVAIALNLYLNKKNTNSGFKPGKNNGIKLFRVDNENEYTYNLSGEKIMKNKLTGYKPTSIYGLVVSYYKDDPRLGIKKKIAYISLSVIVLAIIGLFFSYIFRRKWKKCESTCSVKSE